jgi:hypothetical protein
VNRSLAERLAAAPPNIRDGAMLLAKLAGAEADDRERALCHLPPDMRDEIREVLPPPGLDGHALVAHQKLLIAAMLGADHGGHDWLVHNRGGHP